MDTTELLGQGVLAAQRGLKDKARELLNLVIIAEPRNENAWLWLSAVASDEAEREEFLRQVVAINPQHPTAVSGLQKLAEQRRAKLSAQVAALATAHLAAMSAPIEIAPPKRSGLLRSNPVTGRRLDPRTRRSMITIGGGIVITLLALLILSNPGTPRIESILPTNTRTPTITRTSTPTIPATWTSTPTSTPTVCPLKICTATPTVTRTPTGTRTPTSTRTPTTTRTPSSTSTPTKTAIPANTLTPTISPTTIVTKTATVTRTLTVTAIPSPTSTPTATPIK